MAAQIVRFFSLLFVGFALAPGLAHVLQMPHKMDLSGEDYLRVQQLYAGWSWLGLVVMGALVSTFLLTVFVRTRLRQLSIPCLIEIWKDTFRDARSCRRSALLSPISQEWHAACARDPERSERCHEQRDTN